MNYQRCYLLLLQVRLEEVTREILDIPQDLEYKAIDKE